MAQKLRKIVDEIIFLPPQSEILKYLQKPFFTSFTIGDRTLENVAFKIHYAHY